MRKEGVKVRGIFIFRKAGFCALVVLGYLSFWVFGKTSRLSNICRDVRR